MIYILFINYIGIYKINQLDHIVLDEADTLLDDTFSFETVDLLEHLNV